MAAFRAAFEEEPEWAAQAPGRVNLIGEHVDYTGGLVLPAAIDSRLALAGAAAPAWDVRSSTSGGEAYLSALARLLDRPPQRVAVASDLPARSGLSSSAALLVAAARAWAGSPPRLDAIQACRLCRQAEHEATGVLVGAMDHLASALGQRGHALLIDLADQESPRVRTVPFPEDLTIAVADSGVERRLADTPYNARREESLGGHPRRRRHVETENARVAAFAAALVAGDRHRLGALLLESHGSLRDDFEVSHPAVDALVERAASLPGCLGARIMGAGFGGSVLALLEAGSEAGFAAGLGAPVIFCQTADGAFV